MSASTNSTKGELVKLAKGDAADKAERRREYYRKYNAKRRAKYAQDSRYRRSVIQRERRRYAQISDTFQSHDFGSNAGRAREFSSPKKMLTEDDEIVEMSVLTVPEMAEFIGSTQRDMGKWIRTGKFPEPNKKSKCGKRVFTLKEANALAQVMKDNMAGRASFRQTDTTTIRLLHDTYESMQ